MQLTVLSFSYYCAREVVVNDHYGTKADLWSVGVLAYEMLSGSKFRNFAFFIVGAFQPPRNSPYSCNVFFNQANPSREKTPFKFC